MKIGIGLHQQDAALLCSFIHLPYLFCIKSHRLFAENILAGLKGLCNPWKMQMVRERYINRLNILILQKLVIASISLLKSKL